jgi:hypothetical protein
LPPIKFLDKETDEVLWEFDTRTSELSESVKKLREYAQDESVYSISSTGLSASNRGKFWAGLPSLDSEVYGFGKNDAFTKSYIESFVRWIRSGGNEKIDKNDLYGPGERSLGGFKRFDRQASTVLGLHFPQPDSYIRPDDDDLRKRHPWIPVVQDHPELPNLRWCHAEYAYIPTDKNANIVRFISEDLWY